MGEKHESSYSGVLCDRMVERFYMGTHEYGHDEIIETGIIVLI